MSMGLILERAYAHERRNAGRVFLVQYLPGGAEQTYTWGQVLDEARRMAAHLHERGLQPGARIGILSKNCAHFVIAELAIWMAGGVTVALFPTESPRTIAHVLAHSGTSLLFVGKLDLWAQQRDAVPADLPCIALPLAPAGHGLPRWGEIMERTPPMPGQPLRAGQDLAMLTYTSGSTGLPKGVMHSFERITHAGDAMLGRVRSFHRPGAQVRFFSYLPLAHVMERAWVASTALLDEGDSRMFFGESLETFVADLQRARPTVFLSVPRLWTLFQQRVFEQVPQPKLARLLRVPLLGRFVGRKVLSRLGLQDVVLAASGAAPIAPELVQWYQTLGLMMGEGYGMTEDFGCSHSCTPQHRAVGAVGVPLPGVEVRVGEGGELLVKSPGTMLGYYREPELTAAAFTDDGFVRTGDLGHYGSDGALRVSGRVKSLFKTAKGKYVAPEPIENSLNAGTVVEMSMVAGAGQPAAFGLVVLKPGVQTELAPQRLAVEIALQSLLDAVNTGLAEYERLRMLVVAREPWSIDNGCLTPTLKIRRSAIENAVAARLPDWYASEARVQWG